MKRTVLSFAVGLLFVCASLSPAQTDSDQVKATMEALLASAKAMDVDAAAQHVHELIVAYFEFEEGIKDREAFLDDIKSDPPPEGMSFGDYEPEIYGNVACVLAPVNIPGDEVPIDISVGAILLRADGEWKVLAMCFLAPDFMGLVPEEAKAQVQAVMGGLDALGSQLEETSTSGDLKAFLDLCVPEGVLAGPYGPEGAVVATRVSALAEMAGDMPGMTITPTDDPNEVTVLGMGCALMAVTMTVTSGDAEPRLGRHIAIACYVPAEQAWKILAAVEAPLEE